MKKYFFQKIKIGLPFFAICAIIMSTGVWRSLVARSAGGREVAGSNPVAPISEDRELCCSMIPCLFVLRDSIKPWIAEGEFI
jgi:hypothetical protein